ncbi:MAG: OprD family porin [Epsilonproteobacteria bacterium]|nr:OprD family porin [Campylobacterota bacterium]
MQKKALIVLAMAMVVSSSYAIEPKATLQPNRTIKYNQFPSSVESVTQMFSQGEFYGRIRSNNFYFDWESEPLADGKYIRKDNYEMALGGSVAYKSATYKGVSFNATFYGSESILHMDSADVAYVKSGKDAFSRYEVVTADNWALYSLAVANINYHFSATDIKLGRQEFNSLFTASNDTKMIPNTFEGLTIHSKEFAKTTLKAAYLTKQKLRNHATFHDVITYAKDLNGDGELDSKAELWANNDDSAAHRGLSYINLKNHHKDTTNALIVVELETKALKNTKLLLNYTAVPSLFALAGMDFSYTLHLAGIKLKPAFRYIWQFDNGAGEVGGANLLAVTDGYKDPNSVEGSLLAVKLDSYFSKALRFRLSYSSVADKADIIAPWRGFPTAGYTRAMGQYNWQANTKTYFARVDYDLAKAKILQGCSIMARYAYQDFDETKKTIMTDSNVYNLDIVYKAQSLEGFDTKLRIGYVDAKNYVGKDYAPSYSDYRLEFNYLF